MANVTPRGVFAAINKASDLFDKAVEAYNTARDSIESLANPNSIDLAAAKDKLNAAKARAERAHQSLDEAIEARLNKE